MRTLGPPTLVHVLSFMCMILSVCYNTVIWLITAMYNTGHDGIVNGMLSNIVHGKTIQSVLMKCNTQIFLALPLPKIHLSIYHTLIQCVEHSLFLTLARMRSEGYCTWFV